MNLKTDECIELKNIQYKSMLSKGGNLNNDKKTEVISDLNILDKFLEDNKLHNQYDNWTKMDFSYKLKKLIEYTDKYSEKNNLTETESVTLKTFFKDCIHNKQLNRVKDVVFDKQTKEVKDVPSLIYDRETSTFTIKPQDKTRIHTLKSLPPPKMRGTLKNKLAEKIKLVESKEDKDEDRNEEIRTC